MKNLMKKSMKKLISVCLIISMIFASFVTTDAKEMRVNPVRDLIKARSIESYKGTTEPTEPVLHILDNYWWDDPKYLAAKKMTQVIELQAGGIKPSTRISWELDENGMEAFFNNESGSMNKMTIYIPENDDSNFFLDHDLTSMFEGFENLTYIDPRILDKLYGETQYFFSMKNMFKGCKNYSPSFKPDKNIILKSDGFTPVSLEGMFEGCEKMQSITLPTFTIDDDCELTSYANMFKDCKSLTTIDFKNLKFKDAKDVSNMFNGCEKLTELKINNSDITSASIKLNKINGLFNNCKVLPKEQITAFIDKFITTYVEDFSNTFSGCEAINEYFIVNFDTSNATNFTSMFENSLNISYLDISSFTTNKSSINTSRMFYHCQFLITIYATENFNNEKIGSSQDMFKECVTITGGQNTSYDYTNVDKTYARLDQESIGKPGYFTEGDFDGCEIRFNLGYVEELKNYFKIEQLKNKVLKNSIILDPTDDIEPFDNKAEKEINKTIEDFKTKGKWNVLGWYPSDKYIASEKWDFELSIAENFEYFGKDVPNILTLYAHWDIPNVSIHMNTYGGSFEEGKFPNNKLDIRYTNEPIDISTGDYAPAVKVLSGSCDLIVKPVFEGWYQSYDDINGYKTKTDAIKRFTNPKESFSKKEIHAKWHDENNPEITCWNVVYVYDKYQDGKLNYFYKDGDQFGNTYLNPDDAPIINIPPPEDDDEHYITDSVDRWEYFNGTNYATLSDTTEVHRHYEVYPNIKVKLNFNLDGGSWSSKNTIAPPTTRPYAHEFAVPAELKAEKSGYTFVRWEPQVIPANTLYSECSTITAIWKKNGNSGGYPSGGGGGGGSGGGGGGNTSSVKLPTSSPSQADGITLTSTTTVSSEKTVPVVKRYPVLAEGYFWESVGNSFRMKVVDNGQDIYLTDGLYGFAKESYGLITVEYYYFDEQGYLYTGWLTDASTGDNYFFEDSISYDIGKMVTKWHHIGNYFYYFDVVSGKMFKNGMTPDNFLVNDKGQLLLADGTVAT